MSNTYGSALCVIDIVGSGRDKRKRRRLRMHGPNGQIVTEEAVRRGESDADAHLRLLRRIAQSPAFQGIVSMAGDDIPIEVDAVDWDRVREEGGISF